MAPRLTFILLVLAVGAAANLPSRAAQAGDLDAKGEAQAKEATRLYKEGSYEEAVKAFARLTTEYPDMPIFERSLGACFYYLRKPEPALSNLYNYLNHRKDIPADDKAVVDRWIDEMEKLRARNAAATAPAAERVAPTTTPAGLDLAAASPPPSSSPPVYKRWWFWTGVGAVVVAGTVTAIILTQGKTGTCEGQNIDCLGVR